MENSREYIKGFDSLRGLSILLVIAGHLGLHEWLPESDFFKLRFWYLISGTTGVQIFFCLSGFLITSILIHEKKRNGFIIVKNFYVRRFLRLLPPLIVFYSLIAIFMSFNWIESNVNGFLLSLFYLYNFAPPAYYTLELGHTWSLAVEEQFYLLWPLFIQYSKRYLFIILSFITLFMICIASQFFYSKLPWLTEFRSERWFIPAVAPILAGSFLAFLNEFRFVRINQFFNKNYSPVVISIILFLTPLYLPVSLLAYVMYFQALAITLMLGWIIHNQQATFVLILDNPLLTYIGKISYGLYVYQGLFLRTGPGSDLEIQKFPLNLMLTFVIAVISFHLIERPVLKLKNRFY